MLAPGDLVDVTYDVLNDSQTLIDMAIHQVKTDLASDPRFDYQGSRWDEGYDIDQVPYRHLIVTVSVRKTLRGATMPAGMARAPYEGPAQGGTGSVIVAISMVAFSAFMAAAVVQYSQALEFVSANKRTIAENPVISDQVKIAALKNEAGIGSALAAAGGSLVTAVIIIGVLWALSLSHRSAAAE